MVGGRPLCRLELDAAEAAFAKDGSSQTRIEDVAAAVGTADNYFVDRGVPVGALFDRRRDGAFARGDGVSADLGHAPFVTRLEATLTAAAMYFDTHLGLAPS